MHFNILTLFPEMFPGTLSGGVVGRALENGIWSYDAINIRDFATGNYRAVDDEQFGGGAGQVMLADVIASAIDSIPADRRGQIIYFSPRGRPLNQKMVRKVVNTAKLITPPLGGVGEAKAEPVGGQFELLCPPTLATLGLPPKGEQLVLTLLCGRYEGIDQRVIDAYNMTEISIGDYVLSGGEIAAQVFIDSCVRLVDNVVHGGVESVGNESFEIGGLEWPLYTRPSVWRGRSVPEVLLSGHHGNIERWRKTQSDDLTKERRPDLLQSKNERRKTKDE